jgi:phospholipid transport system substrate-binding protein
MRRRSLLAGLTGLLGMAVWNGATSGDIPDDSTPDGVIRHISEEVTALAREGGGLHDVELRRIIALVDGSIMPRVDFRRMTAAAVGPAWRQATAQQRESLMREFKLLLVRTYAGALSQLKNRSTVIQPSRVPPGESEAIVRSQVRGGGEPIELAYRMERAPDGVWRIYNLNVLGVWLVETYRNQFAPEINAHGVDGLIDSLAERNRANAAAG